MTTIDYRPGLEGVVAAETRMSHVDGQIGELIVGGDLVQLFLGTDGIFTMA